MSNKWIFLRLFNALLSRKLDSLDAHRRKHGYRITTIVIQEARESWRISSLDSCIPRWHMFVAARSSPNNMLWVCGSGMTTCANRKPLLFCCSKTLTYCAQVTNRKLKLSGEL